VAHFAQLDENNIVQQVIVISNNDIIDEETGEESELKGIQLCKSLLGEDTNWKQTSYNGGFRKNYAGYGFKYNATKNAFIPPQPYDSWILNDDDCQWYPPISRPKTMINPDGETLSEAIFARTVWDEEQYNQTGDGWKLLDNLPILPE